MAAELISKTPGWFTLPKQEQRKALEKAHGEAMQPALRPRLVTDGGTRKPRLEPASDKVGAVAIDPGVVRPALHGATSALRSALLGR